MSTGGERGSKFSYDEMFFFFRGHVQLSQIAEIFFGDFVCLRKIDTVDG